MISRYEFQKILSVHDPDRYCAIFSSLDQMVSKVFAQLGGQTGLR
ncbi:DUF4372 domain-containing protein [Marispirochaeta aestuarii]